jgi:dihydrofolate reductase
LNAGSLDADRRMTQDRRVSLVHVAAVADNGVIGRAGALPWRLKSDMQRFRRLTMGKPVMMGRKTYLSLSRKPLPGRTNIVVSRDRGFSARGILVAPDIYAGTIALADRLEITRVHLHPEGDARFPPIDPGMWREVASSEHPAGPDDDAPVTVMVYERVTT